MTKQDRLKQKPKYVKQAWPITTIAKELTLQETHIFAELMDEIGDRVTNLVSQEPTIDERGKHLYLFKEEDFDADSMAYINLDLRNLTERTDCYKNIQKVVEKLKAQSVKFNETTEDKIYEHNMNLFADVIVEKDSYGRRTGILKLAISKYQARYFFDFARWSKYLKVIVSTCDSVHTARLYMLLSANQEYDWVVPYKKLREYLGCSFYDSAKDVQVEKYNPFKNFKTKILDVAKNEIGADKYKGIIDFTFDYECIYADNVRPSLANDPDKIKFIVHKTGAILADATTLPNDHKKLVEYLTATFDIADKDAEDIAFKVLEYDCIEQYRIRVEEIAKSMAKMGDRIKQKKAYAKKSLLAAIEEFAGVETKEAETQQQSGGEEATAEEIVIPTVSEEHMEYWNGFLKDLHDTKLDKYSFWILGIRLWSVTDTVNVIVPTKFFEDELKLRFKDELMPSFIKFFKGKTYRCMCDNIRFEALGK